MKFTRGLNPTFFSLWWTISTWFFHKTLLFSWIWPSQMLFSFFPQILRSSVLSFPAKAPCNLSETFSAYFHFSSDIFQFFYILLFSLAHLLPWSVGIVLPPWAISFSSNFSIEIPQCYFNVSSRQSVNRVYDFSIKCFFFFFILVSVWSMHTDKADVKESHYHSQRTDIFN